MVDTEEIDSVEEDGIGDKMMKAWMKLKRHLETDFALTAWALCVMPEVREDVAARMTGDHHEAIDRIITKLYSHDVMADIDEIIDTFWNQYKHFKNKTGKYDHKGRWHVDDAILGNSYLWHEKYSLPYYPVLGFVACRTTSKLLGIGAAERCWGAVKVLKCGKRSGIGGDNIERQSVLYSTAKIEEARIFQQNLEKPDAGVDGMWGDDDLNFDLQLEKWDVDINELKQPEVTRIFQCWLEPWEIEGMKDSGPLAEKRFVRKYAGLQLYHLDFEKLYTIHDNLEFVKGRGNGWMLIGVPPDSDDDKNDELIRIDEETIEMIMKTKQDPHVKMVYLEKQNEERESEQQDVIDVDDCTISGDKKPEAKVNSDKKPASKGASKRSKGGGNANSGKKNTGEGVRTFERRSKRKREYAC